MRKKVLLIIFLCILISLTGCSDTKSDNYALADLGGVYSSSTNDADFENEITGKLNEDEYDNSFYVWTENSEDINRLRKWGIKRNKDNQKPDADPGADELLSKYNAMYIGDTTQKVIYLTFDEGYENGYTPKILDTLRENNVKAIFFITGPYLSGHQDLVRRMVEEGHSIGNHTIHHRSLPLLPDRQVEEEVAGLERAFKEKFGKDMKFLRPPKGEYSARTLKITSNIGYVNLFWSFAYDDWHRNKIRGPEYAYDIVMKNLHNGGILLLHAVSKDNTDALDMIIKGAKQKGYNFGEPEDLKPVNDKKLP